MSNVENSNYLALASLVQANISGPVKQKLIQKTQERLVKALEEAGIVSHEEAGELLV